MSLQHESVRRLPLENTQSLAAERAVEPARRDCGNCGHLAGEVGELARRCGITGKAKGHRDGCGSWVHWRSKFFAGSGGNDSDGRCRCAVCGRDVARRAGGNPYQHRDADGGFCRGSQEKGLPV